MILLPPASLIHSRLFYFLFLFRQRKQKLSQAYFIMTLDISFKSITKNRFFGKFKSTKKKQIFSKFIYYKQNDRFYIFIYIEILVRFFSVSREQRAKSQDNIEQPIWKYCKLLPQMSINLTWDCMIIDNESSTQWVAEYVILSWPKFSHEGV